MHPVQKIPETKITKEKCGYADRYKGIVMPTCGCRVCWERWKEQRLSREV